MNFDFLNNIPDHEWTLGPEGRLTKAFHIVQLCHALGTPASPQWGEAFDFEGDAQTRRYRHGPCAIPWHTELSCLPANQTAIDVAQENAATSVVPDSAAVTA